MRKLNYDDLNKKYESLTGVIRIEGEFATELVGGQPADEKGVRDFVVHHLKITEPQEVDEVVARIQREELEDATPVGGELPEGKLYGLRALRSDSFGFFLGDWMVKAAIKQAATRLDLFSTLRGVKGNFAEGGRVRAIKYSLLDERNPNLIYLRNPKLDGPPETYHKEFMGRVDTPKGPTSIIHQSQCALAGTRFAFEFRFPDVRGQVSEDDIEGVLAMSMVVGLGSARSLERGKFRILDAEIDLEHTGQNKKKLKVAEKAEKFEKAEKAAKAAKTAA